MSDDTIFALSSGAPPAAIAVVRICGPSAHDAVARIAGDVPPFRQLALRVLRDPVSAEALDHGLVACFPAEGSVTGEALAELHLHGGRATVDAVLAMLAREPGLRAAQPGEFTFRAFSNGKLDLIAVESLSDLLRAETEAQRLAATAEQGLSVRVEGWRRDVLHLSALIEAALDQSDEDDVPSDRGHIDAIGQRLVREMGELLARPGAERLFDGVRVVFAGPPNSGKSTLINTLAGREVAIVSPIAGTTRDVIEAPVKIGGVAFVLTDTAGLRNDSTDIVEIEGISRATKRIDEADIVVWMADESCPDAIRGKVVQIQARSDEPGRGQGGVERLPVSAKSGEGLSELTQILIDRARNLLPKEGEAALNRRQRQHLTMCHASLVAALAEKDELIAAEEVRSARHALDDLTGRAGTEEMLDALFATFCVGK